MTTVVKAFPLKLDVGGPYAIYDEAALFFLDDGSVAWSTHGQEGSCDKPGCFLCTHAYSEFEE